MRPSLVLSALFSSLLIVTTALAQTTTTQPTILTVIPHTSGITYHLSHKMHRVDGTSRLIEGRVRISPEGLAQVSMRARVTTFDSGNSNRDAHMKEVVDAARFPYVELKATARAPLPTTLPATVERLFYGELTFHGVKKALELPIKLVYDQKHHVRASGHFAISLDEFLISRPSLMFIKVSDTLEIDVDVELKS